MWPDRYYSAENKGQKSRDTVPLKYKQTQSAGGEGNIAHKNGQKSINFEYLFQFFFIPTSMLLISG